MRIMKFEMVCVYFVKVPHYLLLKVFCCVKNTFHKCCDYNVIKSSEIYDVLCK